VKIRIVATCTIFRNNKDSIVLIVLCWLIPIPSRLLFARWHQLDAIKIHLKRFVNIQQDIPPA